MVFNPIGKVKVKVVSRVRGLANINDNCKDPFTLKKIYMNKEKLYIIFFLKSLNLS